MNTRDGQTFRPDRHITVPTLTIAAALDRAALPRVDLINLDIEGGEDRILCHWPWERFPPTAICVEIIGLPAIAVATHPLTRFLAGHGMVFASQLVSSVIYLERGFLARSLPRANTVAGRPAGAPAWSG